MLLRLEPMLRRAYGRGFALVGGWGKATAKECNICGGVFHSFVVLSSGDALCPRCGSLDRQRGLWYLLNHPPQQWDAAQSQTSEPILHRGAAVLHFSPSRVLRRKLTELAKQRGVEYVTTDYEGEFAADLRLDITQLPTHHTETFDVVLCYHVLEHIRDDRAAMRELYRVTKHGGILLAQTPFLEQATATTYENEAFTHTPDDRLTHFGQRDHLRIYSRSGLAERLTASGFTVHTLTLLATDFRFLHAPQNVVVGVKV